MIELTISSGIVLVLLLTLLGAFVLTRYVFQFSDIMATLQAGARLGARKMAKELRESNMTYVTITQDMPEAGTDEIDYRLPSSDTNPDWDNQSVLTIWADTATAELKWTDGVDTKVLAENVKKVTFADSTIAGTIPLQEIQIILELEKEDYREKAHNVVLSSFVHVRN